MDASLTRLGEIVVEVEPEEPHRILKLQARAIPRPPDLALPHLNESELIARLRERLNETRSADTFSGAVLLACGQILARLLKPGSCLEGDD
jgi:hypothetical protein